MQSRYMNEILGLTWLLVSTFSSETYANSEWRLEKQKDQISIYSQEKTGSEFSQIKVEVVLPVSPRALYAQFGDGSECLQWQQRCESSKIIKHINENEKLIYTIINMPWPLSDRDFIFHLSFNIDTKTKVITISLTPSSDVEVESDLVRAKSNAQYRIEPINGSSSKLTMLIHTELGGDILPSFVNSSIVDELYSDTVLLASLFYR